MKELQVEKLVKRYPGREQVVAVDRVDVEVEAGEMLVLLGPSGCGKTTLLRCVAGLEEAQEGRIVLEGRAVFDSASGLNQPTHLRDIGMVFQNYSLWPHMTVQRNLAPWRHAPRSCCWMNLCPTLTPCLGWSCGPICGPSTVRSASPVSMSRTTRLRLSTWVLGSR
ncbi:MAG: ABC transporter ATP-binding protein [Betaproteobacteria bacterium]|nr:ABC transporter ATP-binding protein [Betaproteobacteria bacterium]